ncbi:hypothetical protein QTP88_008477 [Uroleucon formosanum]
MSDEIKVHPAIPIRIGRQGCTACVRQRPAQLYASAGRPLLISVVWPPSVSDSGRRSICQRVQVPIPGRIGVGKKIVQVQAAVHGGGGGGPRFTYLYLTILYGRQKSKSVNSSMRLRGGGSVVLPYVTCISVCVRGSE